MAGEELRNRVRQLRFEDGEMTQRQLAEDVGVTRQTIIAIEANRYSPSLKLAFKIAGTFGVATVVVSRRWTVANNRSCSGGLRAFTIDR